MRNVLFLDIDGVLNSTRYWHRAGESLPMGQAGAIDPEAVDRLNRIVVARHPVVILSSSWRTQGVARVDDLLRSRGFRGRLFTATPWKIGCPRCAEIDELLARLPWDVDRYVVLDDDGDAWQDDGPFAAKGRFVNTNSLVGLTDEGVERAIEWISE